MKLATEEVARRTQPRGIARLAMAAAVLCVASTLSAPAAQAAFPRVTGVALYSQREFDAVRVRVRPAAQVIVCVSGSCRVALRWGRTLWTVAAGRLPFRLRRGQHRQVQIFASSNGPNGTIWGPRPVAVR